MKPTYCKVLFAAVAPVEALVKLVGIGQGPLALLQHRVVKVDADDPAQAHCTQLVHKLAFCRAEIDNSFRIVFFNQIFNFYWVGKNRSLQPLSKQKSRDIECL